MSIPGRHRFPVDCWGYAGDLMAPAIFDSLFQPIQRCRSKSAKNFVSLTRLDTDEFDGFCKTWHHQVLTLSHAFALESTDAKTNVN